MNGSARETSHGDAAAQINHLGASDNDTTILES
jgi:hypothetical protein